MANSNLAKAKSAKNDEFYTQYQDIEKEIMAYLEFNPNTFTGKTVLLPCDDPEWSNFTKFFAQNFERLKLKKLISTSFAPESKNLKINYAPTLFESNAPQFDKTKTIVNGKIFTLDHDTSGDGKIDVNDLEWNYLKGDGDFNSEEIKKLRDEADIIITNPPFSLFKEFLSWIMEANKQFVLIGSMNAITYKEVFNLLKSDKMWLGNGFKSGNAYFSSPISNEYANGVFDKETGLVKFRNCCWYTSIDHGKRHQPMALMTYEDNLKFSKHKEIKNNGYIEYDNYNAIEVSFTDAIPSDYDGVMGVPISFLDKYSPEQFEIVGSDTDVKAGKLPELLKPNWNGKIDRGYVKGKRIYSRILIRHKK
ncbi:adenine-specific methyltransferase EcoRI family protein [Flavobacterium psychrophilum]|uniref:adenine-specific methyltransferase EcoRI family protein n=1 Tax=Flavobacterium psychrophilum TaxID=96345 RepID=UPI001D0923E4|nr:adenine-specific methyltransferase EcoRI family protein [Flavobacterium psychrophilum]MCB5984553.1 adenine-specific methyltransferase EcoRI family protein [Flavobacterium psychrophilum]MCB6000499.1 adenine-specific methyltransferase EcoRI family protein [Flavobacterium psychrophilum]MCB6015381.1 adenine-specific methyltransferase EcoRI family protein [Flavobacterium psychrophilum]MCB6022851.1 adenine-specific methyltransferase EcoRI family protein [Flavobacterium psychrophilum]MCB6032791.1 